MELTVEQQQKLQSELSPITYDGIARLKSGCKLVHYTSAENGLNIINNASMWMRSATVMNDYSEIEHGQRCLAKVHNGPTGVKFQAWLNGLFPLQKHPLPSDLISDAYSPMTKEMKYRTFITSFSEHNESELEFGRLSMWRAYGRPTGVAIVMNTEVFQLETNYLKAYASPVLYKSEGEFAAWFAEWVDRIAAVEDLIKQLDVMVVTQFLFQIFRSFALCTKHPAFQEEREWRLFHTPRIDLNSPIQRKFVVLGGVPQPIYEIALRDVPSEGFIGASVSSLIHKILIGPMDFTGPTSDAYEDALARAGVPDARGKVVATWIPLRH